VSRNPLRTCPLNPVQRQSDVQITDLHLAVSLKLKHSPLIVFALQPQKICHQQVLGVTHVTLVRASLFLSLVIFSLFTSRQHRYPFIVTSYDTFRPPNSTQLNSPLISSTTPLFSLKSNLRNETKRNYHDEDNNTI
jgi:hypothetical protein